METKEKQISDEVQELIKLGSNAQNSIKNGTQLPKSIYSAAGLLLEQSVFIPLPQTAYALLGLSRVFSFQCAKFKETLTKKWKAMIGWIPIQRAAPLLRILQERTKETDATLIDRIADSMHYEKDSSKTLLNESSDSSMDADAELLRGLETESNSKPAAESRLPGQVLPRLGLELSSKPLKNEEVLTPDERHMEASNLFDPSDCLDKLSLSLLEDEDASLDSLTFSDVPDLSLSMIDGLGVANTELEARADSAEDGQSQVLDAIFTGMEELEVDEDDVDEHDPKGIFHESQRGLVDLDTQAVRPTTALPLQLTLPEPLARPILVPKSLLNEEDYLPEEDLSDSALPSVADSPMKMIEIYDDDDEEETYGADRRRNQQKSRYDIQLHIPAQDGQPSLEQFAQDLTSYSATKNLRKRTSKAKIDYKALKIPAWTGLWTSNEVPAHFRRAPPMPKPRQRRSFGLTQTSGIDSSAEDLEVSKSLIPMNETPEQIDSDVLSIDDVMRDDMENHDPEISDLFIFRPAAAGKQDSVGADEFQFPDSLEALPYSDSELLFQSDSDSLDSMQLRTSFEASVAGWIRENNGRDTLESIFKSMPRRKELEKLQFGDYIHEIISLETTEILIHQNIKKSSEPIFLSVSC